MFSGMGNDVVMKLDGKVIGTASSLKVDRVKMIEETDQAIGRLMNREREFTLSMSKAVVSPDLLGAMGVMNASFDIKVQHSKLVIGKLPNGRTRLPKRGRLRKKYLKRYCTHEIERETLYKDCTLASYS